MAEPLDKQPNPSGNGAPQFTEDQYKAFLEELAPFLKLGSSLYYAIDKSGLSRHQTAIYEKYRLGDWFSQKVEAYRSRVGELANLIVARKLEHVNSAMLESDGRYIMNKDDVEILKIATKHRTAQPFFVERQETAQAKDKDFGKVVDTPSIEYLVPDNTTPDNPAEPTQNANTNDSQAQDQVSADAPTAPSVA